MKFDEFGEVAKRLLVNGTIDSNTPIKIDMLGYTEKDVRVEFDYSDNTLSIKSNSTVQLKPKEDPVEVKVIPYDDDDIPF